MMKDKRSKRQRSNLFTVANLPLVINSVDKQTFVIYTVSISAVRTLPKLPLTYLQEPVYLKRYTPPESSENESSIRQG